MKGFAKNKFIALQNIYITYLLDLLFDKPVTYRAHHLNWTSIRQSKCVRYLNVQWTFSLGAVSTGYMCILQLFSWL